MTIKKGTQKLAIFLNRVDGILTHAHRGEMSIRDILMDKTGASKGIEILGEIVIGLVVLALVGAGVCKIVGVDLLPMISDYMKNMFKITG